MARRVASPEQAPNGFAHQTAITVNLTPIIINQTLNRTEILGNRIDVTVKLRKKFGWLINKSNFRKSS